jgi:hypothetical protein
MIHSTHFNSYILKKNTQYYLFLEDLVDFFKKVSILSVMNISKQFEKRK